MAIRNSNNYKVAIVPEGSYGKQKFGILSDALLLNDKLEWNFAPLTAERTKKENSLYKAATRTKITGDMVTGTLSGDLTDGHELILGMHFDDDASPYLYATALPTTRSCNIYQLYLNAAGDVVTYDVLLGAILNPLTISGEANGIVQYSCNIEAASYRQEIANTDADVLNINNPAEAGAPFLFGNVLATLYENDTEINSFSIELIKTMVDNALRFQNSLTKTNDRYTAVGGTLSYSKIWDGTNNAADQAFCYNESANHVMLMLHNAPAETATKIWYIKCEGVITETSRPDADRGIFIGNYTFDLTAGGLATGVPVLIEIK
jgi:hypothetical protein